MGRKISYNIIINMPTLEKHHLDFEERSTGVLVSIKDPVMNEAFGSRDLMLIHGVSDPQTVADRLSITSHFGQFTDPILANLNPGTVGTPLDSSQFI